MIIKRYNPSLFKGNRKARGLAVGAGALLTMSSISSVQANYQAIPRQNGSSVTVALAEPTPIQPGDAETFGFSSPLSLNDPMIAAPVPMPEMVAQDQFSVLATPPATPSGTPFVMPKASDPGQAAAPYLFASRNPVDSLRSAICLTTAIYYEAASESDDGQRAVAQVILNRVRHPSWPNTVCGVVYQGSDGPVCQFSYACDGAMARRPQLAQWIRASRIAREALAGYVYAPVGASTFYHTPQVNPAWNKKMIVSHVIGNHIFFRLPGINGTPVALNQRYAGNEPLPGPKPKAYDAAALARMAAARAKAQTALPVPLPGSTLPAPQISAVPVPMPVQPPTIQGQPVAPSAKPVAVSEDSRYNQGSLPESDIMPAYRESGTWIK